MRILYDAFELTPRGGKSLGIYSFAASLWRSLVQLDTPDVEFVVACNPACAEDFPADESRRARRLVLGEHAPGRLQRQLWLRHGAAAAARAHACDTYFSPKGFLPGTFGRLRGLRSVVVVHDLIPLWYSQHHPKQFSRLEQWVVNGGLLRSVRHADIVIAVSQATADDIAVRTGRRQGVMVVHEGYTTLPPEPRLREERYLFAISSTLPHKNLSGVLAAYATYRAAAAQPLPLLLSGVRDPQAAGVQSTGWLTEAQLHTHYAHAEAFLFLSRAEGFGLPPVEVMAAGVPVVCSDIPALREVTQGRAELVSPDDPRAAAAALHRVLHWSADERASRVAAARQVAQRYGWPSCAQGVMAALHAAQASQPNRINL